MNAGPSALACLLVCCPALFGQQMKSSDPSATEAAVKTIKPEAIRAHVRFLSDSLLEGRAPDTRGYELAARYVAAQLEGMGLQPGGSDGKWFQPVPLRKAVLDTSKSSLVLIAGGKERKLVDGQDYVLTGDVLHPESSLEAPIVFVGFGINRPEANYDDY